MKRIFIIILVLSYFGFSSCTYKSKNEEKTVTEKDTVKNACDEFLENYEALITKYLNAIDEYFNNPTDEEIAAHYMEVMQEALVLTEEWEGLVDCADDEKYRDQFEAISMQVEEKLEELGL